MDPTQNADYAAGMISGLLKRYGGNVRDALSAYNAGSPTATGTKTRWSDGADLGYADSVLRHYQRLTGESPQSTGDRRVERDDRIRRRTARAGAAASRSAGAAGSTRRTAGLRERRAGATSYHRQATDYLALLNDDTDETNS